MSHTPTPLENLRNLLSEIHLSEHDRDAIKVIVVDAVTKGFQDGQESCSTEIAQLKARVTELENPWINAKIRLPATNDLYITLGWAGITPYVARFTDGKWFETEYDIDNNEFPDVSKHITHWMPITNPPKPQP